MWHDAKSIIGNLIEDTIAEVCENYSLTVLRQGHKDINPEFQQKLSLNSSKYFTHLLLLSIYKINQNL